MKFDFFSWTKPILSVAPEIFIIAVAFSLPLTAQKEISFVATTDARQVVENGYFQVTFTLNNANGTDFRSPPFKDFKVLNGPSRSMSTTIINGNASQKIAYSYTLQPKKIGKFTIAPATIKANGKELKSNPVRVDVIKADAASKGSTEETQLFVKAEVDTHEIYVGQQLVVDYKLYTTVNIENYDIAFESDYPGFFATDIRRFDSRTIREVVAGVQYTTKVLKRIALFPQQTGLLTIDPMTIRLGVVVGKNRPNSFFFSNQIKPVNTQTNKLEINVKPLPRPIPPSFSGAVGKYAMASTISHTNLTTDDVIAVKLTIRGNGDIKRLQSPIIDFPPSFENYEPKVLNETSEESSGILKGEKTIEYLTLPKQAGRYQLQPAFTYFDTDSAQFVTLAPNLFSINVRQGSGTPVAQPTNLPKEAARAIRYIKTTSSFTKKQRPFPKTGLFYSLLIIPFLILGGALVYKRLLVKNSKVDLAFLKSKQAQKVAKKKLAAAEKLLRENKSRAFYDEVSRAMFGYVCDKLRIPLSELSKENVRGKLQSLSVKEAYIGNFLSIIKTAEMALFAGMDNAAAMEETYQNSIQVISDIEAELT